MREPEFTEEQIKDEEDEIFLNDIALPLVQWRRGGYSDAELLQILNKSKDYASDHVMTVLVDRARRDAS